MPFKQMVANKRLRALGRNPIEMKFKLKRSLFHRMMLPVGEYHLTDEISSSMCTMFVIPLFQSIITRWCVPLFFLTFRLDGISALRVKLFDSIQLLCTPVGARKAIVCHTSSIYALFGTAMSERAYLLAYSHRIAVIDGRERGDRLLEAFKTPFSSPISPSLQLS